MCWESLTHLAESPGTSGCCIDRWCSGSLRKGLEGPVLVPRGGRWPDGAGEHLPSCPRAIYPQWGPPIGHSRYFGGCVLRGQLGTQNLGHQIHKSLPHFIGSSCPCWGWGAWESPLSSPAGVAFLGSFHVALPLLWDPEMWPSAPPERAPPG